MVVSNTEQINSNNMRMTEVNTYYGEQYKSYIELIKNIIWFSLPILILSIIKHKELLPESIVNLMIGLILLIGISYTLWDYYDISRRSKMNFSEYEWDFSKPEKSDEFIKQVSAVKSDNDMKSLSETLGIGCVGMECCSQGMTYDTVLSKCVSSNASPVPSAPCDGLNDDSPANLVKPDCLQKVWTDSGCTKEGTAYPSDSYKGWWTDANGAKTLGGIKTDMKYWGTMTDETHVVGCKGRKEYSTQWKCLPGIHTPVRINSGGDLECMSLNNRDCLWKGNDAECKTLLASTPENLKPLACGAMHKKEWGGTGYDGGHWCQRGLAQLSYKPLGCFGDKQERAMPVLEGGDPTITDAYPGAYKVREDAIVKCYKYAKSKGYKYFAVQDGGHCQGSNNLEESKKYGQSTACSNGKGGGWANDIYEIL
jgi:hypothetical protein